jgi:dihydrolipoamide dehydrogenase
MAEKYDVIIIGSGPAGYVAAIRAGQVGLKTAVVERESLGGMCLNWGCIPTKALLESARRFHTLKDASTFGIDGIDQKNLSFNWGNAYKRARNIVTRLNRGIEYLFKKNGIDWLEGDGSIEGEHLVKVKDKLYEGANILIATGSRAEKIPLELDDKILIDVDQLFNLKELPQMPLLVGEDPSCVELVQFFQLIGKKPKLLLTGERVLPQVDPYLADFILKLFKKGKIDIFSSGPLQGYEDGEAIFSDGSTPCDMIINLSPRRAVLPETKVDLTIEKGFIKVNHHMQTSRDGIYAVGDVNGVSMFAHAASAQGLLAINKIKGIDQPVDPLKIPINIYTIPELAQLGSDELSLQEIGTDYKISQFPLSANGKALIEGSSEGFIRILSEKKYGEVLGVQIVAPHATDMIAEAAALMQLEGTVFDVARTIHAHPTISEVYGEAGLAAFEQPIHL